MASTGPDQATDAPPAPDRALAPGRRRVCVLSCPTGWGGAELHTVELVRTLVERGNAVTLVQFGKPFFATHARLPEGVRLVTLRFDVPPQQVAFGRWIRILWGLRCDAGVFAKAQVDTGSLALDLAARLCFRRYIVIEQVSPPNTAPQAEQTAFRLRAGHRPLAAAIHLGGLPTLPRPRAGRGREPRALPRAPGVLVSAPKADRTTERHR